MVIFAIAIKTDEEGNRTAVHNAFDPDCVLELFQSGKKVRSITGREYKARDFCRMVEYAAGRYDIDIDDAEKVFPVKTRKRCLFYDLFARLRRFFGRI